MSHGDNTIACLQHYTPGHVIGARFELVNIIGQGGMGVVWSARDLLLQVDVAVKLMSAERLGPQAMKRLAVEARATAAVRHPSVVSVLHCGVSDLGDPFIVIELLEGMTLDEKLDEQRVLSSVDAVRVLIPIAEALAVAHDAGVIHRDLKPSNIFLAREGKDSVRPKLLDFGIARIVNANEQRLTVTGNVLGTPHYMSPEQAAGKSDVDHRADIWALSVMAYEMLVGWGPYEGDNYNAVLTAVLLHDYEPLPEDVDGALAAVVTRGLQKDRDVRWQSGWDLHAALAAWLREETGEEVDSGRLSLTSIEAPDSVDILPVLDLMDQRAATLLGMGTPPPRDRISTEVTSAITAPPVNKPAPPRSSWRTASMAAAAFAIVGTTALLSGADRTATMAHNIRAASPAALMAQPTVLPARPVSTASPSTQAASSSVPKSPKSDASVKAWPPQAAKKTKANTLPLPERPRFR